MTTTLPTVGIDLAKAKFDVVVQAGTLTRHKVFAQGPQSAQQVLRWLRRYNLTQAHFCMEATGTLGDELAADLHTAGQVVSIINPVALKAFRQTTRTRTKTDKTDAGLLARYCRLHQPAIWEPPAPEFRQLQALERRLEALQAMRQQELNRLSSGVRAEAVTTSIHTILTALEAEIAHVERLITAHLQASPDLQQQHDLLCSIKGVGTATARKVLAECGDLRRFPSARQLAAFAGVTPREFQSGSSVRGKPRMSKVGSAQLRKALFFPAIVAKRFNPIIQPFCQRLADRGKHKLAIIGAAMRKLLHLMFGVIHSNRPFDPNFHPARSLPA